MKEQMTMNDRKAYTGIDYFRFAAALLVAAIHTSPLASSSETADFFLTRIAARVAVPFFLMASGFFLISQYAYDNRALNSFLKKTALLYGVSIVLYLPLNLYNGYFSMKHFLPEVLKDLVFDGTMYHLWYLPASMLGAVIAWYLVRKQGMKKGWMITVFLYVMGLLGDSYYGMTAKVPMLNIIYENMFEIFDYTRNGVFFAPVFLVMGGMAADEAAREETVTLTRCIAGFGISFLLMSGEGMLLHKFGLQRHDSMYLFLLPCMYFLFRMLLLWRGERKEILRTSALLIYILHPLMIVVVRMAAKAIGQQSLLIENSLVHFLAVCVLTLAAAFPAAEISGRWKQKRKPPYLPGRDRAWVELDLNNLKHNVKELKNAMPSGCEMMAVMKAEAYGHGMYETAVCVSRMGVKAFAVASIEEGIRLRRYGIQGEILILGYTDPARARELCKYDLTQTLINYPYARLLNKQRCPVKVHVKVDTGMHRLGFGREEVERIAHLFSMRNLKVCGIYTHLCVADSLEKEDVRFTEGQLTSFYGLLERLEQKGARLPRVHIQSSYGLLNYPEISCDYVRIGISLYGVPSSPGDDTRQKLDLRPVLSLKSRVVLIRKIRKGESVGYGRAFIAQRDSRIAVLPVGYADGIPRNLSCGCMEVILHGQSVPVIGRICMDQMIIDITDAKEVSVGDVAVLIGTQGREERKAAELAGKSETITNELLSRLGGRLVRTTVS